MQFGLNFFPCVDPAEKSAEQYFREAIYLAGLTDELGYTHVRQVEHYLQAVWRIQPQSADLPHCGGAAHDEGAADHRRGTAGVQFTAEDGRRDWHA
jgi:hypothetical protein